MASMRRMRLIFFCQIRNHLEAKYETEKKILSRSKRSSECLWYSLYDTTTEWRKIRNFHLPSVLTLGLFPSRIYLCLNMESFTTFWYLTGNALLLDAWKELPPDFSVAFRKHNTWHKILHGENRVRLVIPDLCRDIQLTMAIYLLRVNVFVLCIFFFKWNKVPPRVTSIRAKL